MPRFRVIVDKDLCQGHGECKAAAPEIFDVTDQGNIYDTVEVLAKEPAPGLYEKAKRAEKLCPNGVITIEVIDEE